MNHYIDIMNSFNEAFNETKKQKKVVISKAEEMKDAALRYQSIAARKMTEYYKLYEKARKVDNVNWVADMLKPLLTEIEERTGWEFEDKEGLRTFGLRAECPVFVLEKEAYIVFTSKVTEKDGVFTWQLFYDTGENICEYPAGSIADLNNFGRKVEKVESVEQVIDFLQKQMSNQ